MPASHERPARHRRHRGADRRLAKTIEEATTAARQAAGSDSILERILEKLGGRAGVEAVFGEPIRSGDRTVVPVARVRWAGGAGSGASEADGASGSGGGAAFRW